MEGKISEDIGDEIIIKLKEINKILKNILRRNNAKECTNSSCIRNFSA
ncbi:hypothetical protein KAS08_02345 [Candidatus Pacearchaeota archaeon]|nr:hypothetical protein [Candidatus Pacearchaeota archaeon]